MFRRSYLLSIFLVLSLLLLSAAQCGPASEGAAQPVEEGEHQEDGHEHEEEADDHEHEEEVHSDEGLTTAPEALQAVSLASGEKLKVVATTNIVGDLVRNVGGDMIDLRVLLPAGSDPHAFSATPQDVATVADADVIFINGFGLEAFLRELLENAGGEAPVVSLSEGINPREFAEEDETEHAETGHEEDHEEAEADHHHDGVDPHTFMTAENAMVFVDNAEGALSHLDPANASRYEVNAEAYTAQLAELESWIQEQINTIPPENRQLVTDHDAFGYYTDHYGLEVVGSIIPAYSTSAEPSARELAQLQDAVAEHGVKAVFVGTTVNPTLAQRLAEDLDIQLVPLYSDSLGPEGSGVESYVDYMRHNTNAIVAALKP